MNAVLWYVHDAGSGHLQRAAAVLRHLRAPIVVAAGPGVDVRRLTADAPWMLEAAVLPSDVPRASGPTTGPWHWAPASAEVRARGQALSALITRYGCTTAVVDVSVEVTVLCRLLGLRVVSLRQSGRRDDEAHRIGFESADVVWVPQHAALEPLPDDLAARATFTGAFSRFDDRPRRADCRAPRRTAVILLGAGGHRFDAEPWRRAASPPGWRVVIAGLDERWDADGINSVGVVADVAPLLTHADVVVTAAGWASVADTVSCGARLVVVPEPRPFDEQLVRARALADAGLAIALDAWPCACALAAVLEAAMDLDPDAWSAYYDGRGAVRAAQMISDVHGS